MKTTRKPTATRAKTVKPGTDRDNPLALDFANLGDNSTHYLNVVTHEPGKKKSVHVALWLQNRDAVEALRDRLEEMLDEMETEEAVLNDDD